MNSAAHHYSFVKCLRRLSRIYLAHSIQLKNISKMFRAKREKKVFVEMMRSGKYTDYRLLSSLLIIVLETSLKYSFDYYYFLFIHCAVKKPISYSTLFAICLFYRMPSALNIISRVLHILLLL